MLDDVTLTLPGAVAEQLRELFPGLEPWAEKVHLACNRVELYEKKVALMGSKGQCPHCGKKLTDADRERLHLNGYK